MIEGWSQRKQEGVGGRASGAGGMEKKEPFNGGRDGGGLSLLQDGRLKSNLLIDGTGSHGQLDCLGGPQTLTN